MITISKKTEYSLLLIEYLGKKNDAQTSLTDVSLATGMPYRFLGQLASILKAGGILTSKEGKSGGYALAAGWQKKSMYELLEILGEDKHMVACLGDVTCSRSGSCSARKVWGRLEQKVIDELQKIKLSEL